MPAGEGTTLEQEMAKRVKDRRQSDSPLSPSMERRGADRRLHERVLVDIEVDYRADETFLFAYITDISAMGIFVQTNTPEPEGTRLNLCFRLPDELGGRLMEIEGEVAWINPHRPDDSDGRNPGMGIRFVDLMPAERDELMRMVRTFAFLDDEEEEEIEKPFAKC
jgi:type IV pilus assembly protein PilZ